MGSVCAILKLLGKKAKPGKPGDAKSWVYNHVFVCDQDCQTAKE